MATPPPDNHPFLGLVCILLGLYPIVMAAKWLPLAQNAVHAPLWVISLSGVVFIIAGMMLSLRQHPKLNNLLAAILLASMAAIGGWIAFLAPPDGFSGGIPFLSKAQNIALARSCFGFGAFVSAVLCGYAIRQFLRAKSNSG
jgi:uncharacterized protein YjeT (DUF2065 family)